MPGIETSRDVFGVVRGACARCDACAKYVKNTNEYHAKAALDSTTRTTHAHNDVSLQNCSRCGCAAMEHVVDDNGDCRARGNDLFEAGRFEDAIVAYTRAISAYAGDAKSYSNRAACYLKRTPAMPQQALHDARHAVRLDGEYAKARTRLGQAAFALGHYDDAQKAFEMALKLDARSKAAQTGLREVQAARAKTAHAPTRVDAKAPPPTNPRTNAARPDASVMPQPAPVAHDVSAHESVNVNSAIREAKILIDKLERVLGMFREELTRLENLTHGEVEATTKAATEPTTGHKVYVSDFKPSTDATTNASFGDGWDVDDASTEDDDSGHMARLLRVAEGLESEEDVNDGDDVEVDARAAEMLQFFQDFAAEDETSSDEDDNNDDAWAERWEEEQFARRQSATHTAPANAHKRPPKDGKVVRPPGLRLDSLSSLFETQVETAGLGDGDHASTVRGPCKTCDWNSCPSFARRSLWKQSVLSSIPLTADEYKQRLTQLTLSVDGAFCARCGCDASAHCTVEEFDKIRRKQRRDAEAKSSAEEIRRERVRIAAERVADAEANGECICETSSDMLTGAERRACESCTECTGFRVIFRESDAMNPDVMFYCSMCGCSYETHVVCSAWQREQESKRVKFERDTKARRAAREREQANVCTDSKHFATLNLSPGASKRDIAKAYKILALKYHPDKHAGKGESERKRAALNFIRATEAFKALT